MATVTETETETGQASTFRPHGITVDRYQRMVDAGVFRSGEPIFLWRGRLVEKMTRNEPHSLAVLVLTKALDGQIPDGWHARPQAPVALGEFSMPEPDISVVRGTPRDYARRHPRSGDVAILIEVADSSLKVDSGDKLEAYAAQGIPSYWIVNIPNRRIEVYTEPTGPAAAPASYRSCQVYGADQTVPVVLGGRDVGRIAVRDVVPEPLDDG